MSGIPKDIPGYGSVQSVPRQNPRFVPDKDFSAEDYFVWSRMDGRTMLRDVILSSGLGTERTLVVLGRLKRLGAVLEPGGSEASTHPGGAAQAAPAMRPAKYEAPKLTADEAALWATDCELDDDDKQRILEVRRKVKAGNYFELLGVDQTVDDRDLKRAYFRLSKEFHPDRWFRLALGAFGEELSRIFETSTFAYQVLVDPESRADHIAQLRGDRRSARGAQAPAEHAAELFSRGAELEAAGHLSEAFSMFGAAARVEASPRYLTRAARVGARAGKLSEALEYATHAARLRPHDAAIARVVADVHRALGDWPAAAEVLHAALSSPGVSDVLVGALEADLAAVRGKLGLP